MSRSGWLAAAAVLLACALGAASRCGSAPPALEVEYANCWALYRQGPVCALWPTRQLTIWIKTDPGVGLTLQAGGARFAAAPRRASIAGGRRFTVTLPAQAPELTVQAAAPGGGRGASWSLRLSEPEVPPWMDGIYALQSQGRMQEIRQRLDRLRQTARGKERGLVFRMLAALAKGDGDDEQAAAYLEEGLRADRAAGELQGEVHKRTLLAGIRLAQGRFAESRQDLEDVVLPPEAPAEARYFLAYYHGSLADGVGDYRSALEHLREAAALARRTGLKPYRWMAEQVLARLLQDLGRSEDAEVLFARLAADPHPESPCDLGDLLTNRAWARLLAREGSETTADPTPILEQARDEYDENSCPAAQRLNARLNLALAHLQELRWARARQALDEAGSLVSPGHPAGVRQHLWWSDLTARLALAEGRADEALRLYTELAGMADRALSFEGRFRAAFGRAQAERARGRPAAALDALAEADRRIDEQSWRIPVHEGRDAFVGQREKATRLYLELLLSRGRRQDAFALARRSRARLLQQLAVRDRLAMLMPAEQQRWVGALERYTALREAADREAAAEWELPADRVEAARARRASELARAQRDLDRALAGLGAPGPRGEHSFSPPGRGEVVLAYHPLPVGWVGFAADERGIEVHRFVLPTGAPADSEALSRCLLAPFRDALARASRVRVLPYGPLRAVDFHLLPLYDEPLLARHLVVYSLDLPPRPGPQAQAPARGAALLVSDPLGDLQAAREEAKTVSAAIRGWGPAWSLRPLTGPDALARNLRQALPSTDLFHYAGHGTFAGLGGWDSTLALADGSRLGLGDLLALRRAPRWVVLSACDGGRSSAEAPAEGIGLAQAFLLAGSQAVVAATRPVDDASAGDLVGELYRGWQPGADLPEQLRRAQRACLRRAPAADCASFRLLEP